MNDTFLLFHLFFIKPVIPALIEQPLTLLLTQERRKNKTLWHSFSILWRLKIITPLASCNNADLKKMLVYFMHH